MDKFKNMAGDAMDSGIGSQLKDINFPCSKDQLLVQLEQKGVPGPVLDRIRDTDTSHFDSAEEVRNKIGL